ncbi:nitroreductase [Streptomyces sp. WAC04189]|nr:nitroreductase family protein [Streptomyces sp. WAC04189]RSR96300.1 nitroreductase [Streptomyces sp. WAC04189]
MRQTRTLELYADFERAMPYSDSRARGLHIGCGAALLNLRVAAAHDGWHAETRLQPRPEDSALLATVRLTGPRGDDSDLAPLHPAITERHSSRFPFEAKRIPDDLRGELVEAARREGATLAFPAPWHLQHVLDVVRETEARVLTDRATERELGGVVPHRRSVGELYGRRRPGLRLRPHQKWRPGTPADFAGTRRVAGRDTAGFEAEPQLACVSGTHDRPEDWLRAGQAVERVLLLATADGLVGSLATQPLERPDLRWLLRDPVTGAGPPQMLLRLGRGPKGPWTPRRPVSEVLDVQPRALPGEEVAQWIGRGEVEVRLPGGGLAIYTIDGGGRRSR